MKFSIRQYFGESREEPKGGPEGSHQGPRRPPRARREASWLPGPTPGAPSGLYYPLGVETLKREEFRSFTIASWRISTEKKKPSSAGRFRRGDRRHRHHHRHGHHRDHHEHHPQHQHHLHLHPITSHNYNLCCNPYYLSPLLYWCSLLLCGECY